MHPPLLLESHKFQNLCSVFKHATSMILMGSRRTDSWPGQEVGRIYKYLEFELQQSSPKIAGTLGLGAWGFLCSPPLNCLGSSTCITCSLFVEGLLSSGNYIFRYIFLCVWPFGLFTLAKTKPRHGKSKQMLQWLYIHFTLFALLAMLLCVCLNYSFIFFKGNGHST